jgi:hypothetical protein
MNVERISRIAVSTIVRRFLVVLPIALLLAAPGSAAAKDSVKVTVSNATGAPIIVKNGEATGTIQLFYTVNAAQFTLGAFATFDLNWIIVQGGGNPTNYGSGVTFDLQQDQQGGNVDLSPSPGTFLLTAIGQSGVSTVSVFITADKDGNPPSNADGTDLVGNLKLDAGSKVGTVSSIQVHIRLVHPSSSQCLRAYDFVTDQDFNVGILSTTSLTVPKNGAHANQVVSSNPGQFSDNVLIANTCATDQSFDLGVGLDSGFAPNGANAVFTFTEVGAFDTSNYTVIKAGTGTPRGQVLCLQNVTVAAGSSFLATVHSKVADNLPKAFLPADGTFDFTATLFQNVNSGCTGAPHPLASPNPATFTLPFTF